MPNELFDVVDERDQVIDRLPRAVVHARKLLHRAVHIFVFDDAGRMYVQLRSATKDEYPNCFTSSCSGHVDAGEDYDTAAIRELREELGLVVDGVVTSSARPMDASTAKSLTRLQKFPAGENTSWEHTVLYRMQTSTPLQPDLEEIAGGDFHMLAEIEKDIANQPTRYCPAFKVLLRWYCENLIIE